MQNLNNRIKVKDQLQAELRGVNFSSENIVLQQTHPKSLRDKLLNFWNKEIEIPIIPVASCIVLFIGVSLGSSYLKESKIDANIIVKEESYLVDTGVGIYWSHHLKEGVSKN